MEERSKIPQEWNKFYLKDVSFVNLMTRRIFNVLIVANPYDAFMLEDDGRIDEKIFDEYMELGMRYPPTFTQVSTTEEANEVLRNGIDRSWDGADNGVWVAPGEESVVYSWKKPVTLSGARLIFDSHFKVRSKRMRKLEATTERVEVPPMMARAWRLEARVKGAWKTVYEEKDNYLRLRQVRFAPVSADALRVVIDQTWGADKAHIFAFDAR